LNLGGKSLVGQVITSGQTRGNFAGVSTAITHTDRLVNISTRGLVGDGEKAMFAGFVITGSVPKAVLVRASGPTLGSFGVPGAMDNPVLSIVKGVDVVASNDDWASSSDASLLSSTALRVGGFALNANSKDAALITTLAPGVYSAQVARAAGSSVGLALVEVYDAGVDPGGESQKVVNISTRGEVKTGVEIMIAGFVITGNVPKKVLIRGVGPTLGSYGVGQTLTDPQLDLYNGTTLVASNNDWGSNASASAETLVASNNDWGSNASASAEMMAAAVQVGAFPLTAGTKDAAMLVTLAPGVYSAQVSGVGGTTGVVLLEVYEVP
jgi:hypothetical protein